jgi:hypothetical protein
LSNSNLENITTEKDLDEFTISLKKQTNHMEYEINTLSSEINRLNVSENNILSLNIVSQKNLSKIIRELVTDTSNKDNIYSLLKHNDISKLLD